MQIRSRTLPAALVGFACSACMSSYALAQVLPPAPVQVPTLDEFGLIALAGLLAAAGGAVLARRNKKK